MNEHFILNFTPTGMIPTKEMTPHVPVDPDEIVSQVLEVADLGVNMVHLHARDPETKEPTWRPEIYAELIGGIRKANRDLVLCVSTSGRNFPEFEKRSAVLELDGDLKPDFGSLTLASLNFPKQASLNSPQMVQDLARKMHERGIKPELEAFDLGMVNYGHYLVRKGLAEPPHYFNIILGNIAGAQADLLTLGLMIRELPPDSYWSIGGIGAAQLTMNATAVVNGGGIRIGLEDNIHWDASRSRLASNREMVERILAVADAVGRKPYPQAEARKLLMGEKG